LEETDRAWAAGFFDGEGCCNFSSSNRRLYMGQKDRRVLDKFQGIVGGKVYGPFKTGNVYQYYLGGEKAQEALLLMWPYLSEIKRKQALKVGFSAPKELAD